MLHRKHLLGLTLTSLTLYLSGCGDGGGNANTLSPEARLACDNVLAELAGSIAR